MFMVRPEIPDFKVVDTRKLMRKMFRSYYIWSLKLRRRRWRCGRGMTDFELLSIECSLYRLVRLPFIMSSLVPLGQFKNVNTGSVEIPIMSSADGCYYRIFRLIFHFSSSELLIFDQLWIF